MTDDFNLVDRDSDTDDAHEQRLDRLPDEERDDDRTVGAGMLDAGGTSIDRGTGTLTGEAQGRDVEADDDQHALGTGDGDDVALPTEPGGGTH